MKNIKTAFLMVIVLSMIILVACTKDTKRTQDSVNTVDNTSKTDSSVSTDETTVNNNIQETNTTNIVTKIDGRREEFLGRLDSIQKQLDNLPEKKDSDAGITNAMRSYYGESYDMYDEVLNEIYSLLKEKLSQDTMRNLQAEEIKWIKQKEDTANKSASQYKGGTFEFVAYNMSLYESTKNRCYELVNNYMTDSKIKINANKQDYINKLDNMENKILLSPEYKNAATGVTSKMIILADKEYND
ncbi:MAG: lysozyme inhibitor LprI family protein [Clostridium sp.]|uniref:lysozyme inhibitor LprI family protein n=1 Tax=Clostridium sp. TaxID=1506 RepID=UPI0025C06B1F|nr:lysozyme inhibitor LprI family protein [Clostridium sp.]MCE5221520.1 lysozyme inhibitor LprI family protein [Clostridium sp.]